MKKIGILTYFGDYNNGTNLQAYCVWKLLAKYYPEAQVKIIDFHSWKHTWRPMLYWATWQSVTNDFIRRKKNIRFLKALPLTSRKLITSDIKEAWRFIDSFRFDTIYVGSDTLLELHRAAPDNITPYWLTAPYIRADKIMLAASSREADFDSLSTERRKLLAASIGSFRTMGVRDEATYKLIQRFTGDDAPKLTIVPDPTFFYSIDYSPADAYAGKHKLGTCEKPIILLHVDRHDRFASELACRLKAAGYLIASLRPFKAADFLLNDLSPFEYAGIFKYMYATITHRFHDTIFSIKNGTPVLTYLPGNSYTTPAGDSKYSSLMKGFGLYETNLLVRPEQINAEGILRRFPGAVQAFRSAKTRIASRLADLKNELENFIGTTVLLP